MKKFYVSFLNAYLLLNLRSPRDYVVRSSHFVPPSVTSFVRSRLLYFLSPLDGASVCVWYFLRPSTSLVRWMALQCVCGTSFVRVLP